ncbi:protein kinase [Nostoc sp.]|uniref:protein kinase domain-containing protein n=1 Tax=Nostoc sp. TaxID=1180 RepID=UPI0035944259
MSYCINPECQIRDNVDSRETCLCCVNQLHIRDLYWLVEPLRPLSQSPGCEVFEVVEDMDDMRVTKVLKSLKSNEVSAIRRFGQEANILSSLSHPGIPKADPDEYFSHTLNNGRILKCLVMEKIEGQNLKDWLEKNEPISQDLALTWLKELAEILGCVHQGGFLHRDIKPSNIIRKPNGQLVLIDFGVAKRVTDAEVDEHNSTVVYSIGYTAVEQLEGRSVPQSDFFALGRTFVHLLTGSHPKSLINSKTEQFTWKQSLQQEVSDKVANFIDELMAPKVQDRPKDTQAIQLRIKQIYDDLYPPLEPEPLPQPPFRWYRWAVIFGFPVILLVVIKWLFLLPPPLCNSSALDVSEMAFSRNGSYLVTASLDNTVRVSKAASNNKQVHCELLRDGVVALKFSPSDSTKKGAEEGTIATVKLDGGVELWNVDTEGNIERSQILQVLGRVVALAFSPQGNYLATAAEGGTVQVWDTNTYEEIKLRPYGSYIKAVSFSQDEKYLAIVGLDKKTNVWEWQTTDKLTPLPNVVAVAFSPKDSKYLATGDVEGNVKVLDTNTFKVVNEVNLGSYPTAISFSPEGKHLLLLGLNKKAKLWEWEKHNATITLERTPKDKVVAATFSPKDGKYIATASANGTIRVWNNDGTWSADLPNSYNSLTAVAFNPKDEQQLGVATADGSVQIINRPATKQ